MIMAFNRSPWIVVAFIAFALHVSVCQLATEHGSQVECYNTPEDGCSGTPDPRTSSPRECCLGDGYWYRLGPSGECVQCIVHGFQQTAFVSEEGTSLPIPIHLNQKGNRSFLGRQTLRVNVIHKTADSSDYRLRTASSFRLRNSLPHLVKVNLENDDVALEGNETFQLELEINPELEDNEFLRNICNITITDETKTTLEFVETDYGSEEGDGNVNVQLRRLDSNLLASDLVLHITPLTFEEARERGISLPSELPASATRQDYGNSPPVEVVLSGSTRGALRALIPISDDEINELEEGFMVILEVASAVDPALVDLTGRNTALCRIRDNDRINIGFEKGEYTFNESDGAIFDTVTLIKDRPTEQTFIVSVIAQMQKSYRDATAGKDFSVDHQINLHFGPEMNTLAVRFEIFDDAVPEGTEAFQFFSFMGITKDNPNFDCKLAEGCLPSTLIKINDDDVLTVGFETPEVTVLESDGAVMLCVITEPANEIEFNLEAILYSGTAGVDDFVLLDISLEQFSESLRRQCFNVTILDDSIAEGTEMFAVTLQIAVGESSPQVRISPASANIEIIDDEYLVGIEHEAYNVSEGDGLLELCAILVRGIPTEPAKITLTTVDGRAAASKDYTSIAEDLVLNSVLTRSCVEIPILNDIVPENDEDFTVRLTVDDDRAVIATEVATVTISDDDELHVSINVSYIPPRGTELEPNEYRAASGPVTVTCTAVGGTGPVSYQWASTCRNCTFLTAKSSSVYRAAVHSGDTGTHTCTATRGSTTGSASINFSVVGAGIHLFRGASTGILRVPRSLPNNEIVVSLNAMSDFRFRFVCRSDSMVENTGTLIGLDGTVITTGSVFTIAHPQLGELRAENIPPQYILTASDQGVYTCRIPLQSGETRDIHVGIYPSGFNTLPNITHLGFTHGPTSSTLTCISTGSPATNVTWMKDRQPLTIDGSLYQPTQTVTNRILSTYENVLTINAAVSNIYRNIYTCTVVNVLGRDSKSVLASPLPRVTISSTGTPTAGMPFSLTCSVTLEDGGSLTEDLTVQWEAPVDISVDSDIAVVTNDVSTLARTSALQFTPVRTSHGGQYTCKATTTAGISVITETLIVKIPPPTLALSSDPDATVTLHHGDPLILTCSSQLDETVDSDVMVTLRLQGRAGGSSTIVTPSDGLNKIILYIPSLRATPSDTYTCTATVEPGSGVMYVQRSELHNSLNITVELHVSINVSYIPPRGAELEPNEYRAASGPVTVTCTAVGGTGPVSYQWASTCRDCPFLTARSSSVYRAAVHSGDTGTHTCTATRGSTTGSASINFSVVGAGIHLFRGASTGILRVPRSLPNNEIVVSLNAMSDFRFRFVCRSDSMVENTGTLIGLDGTVITTGSVFTIAHPQLGELRAENIPPQYILTASDQGVYTCRIPLQSGETRDIHVGIYPSGFNTLPNITHLGFTHGPTSSTLTCISTGSPATNVTWMKDGQPLTIDGSLYQLTQTVTDRTLSAYENVLTINAAVSNIYRNIYTCTVVNVLGRDSKSVLASPLPRVTISSTGTPTAGMPFSHTCSVTLEDGGSLTEDLTVQWEAPVDIGVDSDIAVVTNEVSTLARTSALKFTPVRTSHGGQYTCKATTTAGMDVITETLVVKIPPPTLALSRDPDATVTLHHGDPLILTCIIQLDETVDSDVVVTGRLQGPRGRNSSIVTPSDGVYKIMLYIPSLRATPSDTYICTATVEPGSGVMNVQRSELLSDSLNITVELHVSINVSYIPPRGTELEPNEYRAASGPVTVTCTAVGGTGPVSYQWSSTCRDCPFQTAKSSSVYRAAVHSGDTGTHTCTATRDLTTGSASINFNVVGAGIHLFKGASTGILRVPRSLPNNGIVVSLNATSDLRFQFVCRSDSMVENTGTLIGPDGTIITTGSVFTIAHVPGDLRVENIPPQNILTASDQGVYTCRIPLQSGEIGEINVGIYPSGFNTPPYITHLGFTHGPTSSTLTCVSTGSPATTVTWMKDGQPLTIDGSFYQLTQTVTDRRLSTYENVLTINAAVFRNAYACSVHNALGSQTRFLTEYMIGIEHEDYHVSEGDEYVEVCAILVRGLPTKPGEITLTTFDGGAAASKDYTSTTEVLVLNSATTRSCIKIPILNDVVPEIDEDFTVRLTVNGDHADIATEVATVTISDDDEPEEGCSIKVLILTATQERNQKTVVEDVVTAFPRILDSNGTEPTSAEELFASVYSSLAEDFGRVESDTGYTNFVEAVTEITEARQEACSGPPDERLTRADVPGLAQRFSRLSLSEANELRKIFGEILCIRTSAESSARKKRQDPCAGTMCPARGFDDPSLTECQFFECLDNDIEDRYGTRLEVVFNFLDVASPFPCLGFVVDTTGSMADEIRAVQNLIMAFISSEQDEPACYVITQFNDWHYFTDKGETPPGPDYGPAMVYDTSRVSDLVRMRDNILDLRAAGGGDCAEYGMNGLWETLISRDSDGFETMTEGSQMILITDAYEKNTSLVQTVISQAFQRKVCIHLFLSLSGCGRDFSNYVRVATETGGRVVRGTSRQFDELIGVFGEFSTAYQDSPCSAFYSRRKKRQTFTAGRCHTFRVSTFTDILKFLIITTQSRATVRKPSGETVSISVTAQYGAYREVGPEPGEWSVCVESGTFTIQFNNRVLLDFVVTFVKDDESSPGRLTATSVPPPACSTGEVAVVSSRIPDISSARLNFIRDGSVAASAPLTLCGGAMIGNATFPLGSVTYQIQGEDVGRNPFVISRKTVEFKPGKYSLAALSDSVEIVPGERTVFTFELHNQNSDGSTNFTFTTESTSGVRAVPQQTNTSLKAGEGTEISVHITAGSIPGAKEVTLIASDGCTRVTASQSLSITRPELPTAAPDACGCENGGTCVSVTRRGRVFNTCRCPPGYGGRICDIVF